MSNKTPVIISVLLTIILLILLGIFVFFISLVTFNGFSEREGGIALVASGVCEIAGIIFSAILARKLTNLFITKFNWNNILAVILSTLAGTILGGVFYVIGFILSIIVAETLH